MARTLSTLCLIAALPPCSAWASDAVAEAPAKEECRQAESHVEIREIGSHVGACEWTYVISHGMGGTKRSDRFHLLAEEIKRRQPAANVYLVDWSRHSKGCFGLPIPWTVAGRIDDVGDVATKKLAALKIHRRRCTLIGESFGNWVNCRIASNWNGVERMLLFNPPCELGGYPAPNANELAGKAWTFHTDSPFDTRRAIGHRGLYLQTTEGTTSHERHVYGICWLHQLLVHGRRQWLLQELDLPVADSDHYAATVEADGDMDFEPRLRTPAPTGVDSPAPDSTLAHRP